MSPNGRRVGGGHPGDGALGHALGCWSPTADRVALTVLPDDVAIGAGAVEVPPGTPWSGATGP